MADRTLAHVTDQRDEQWCLTIERSAAGKPGGQVVIEYRGEERGSVVVADLYDLIGPVVGWLEVAPSDLPDRALLEAHAGAMIRADHLLREITRRLRRSTDDQ